METMNTKYTAYAVGLLLSASVFVGCQSTGKGADPENKRAVVITIPDEYAYSQRSEYVTEMNKQLSEDREELAKLTERVSRSTGTAKADASAKLEGVRSKMEISKAQLEQAEQSTEERWAEIKKSFKASYEDMNKSLDEARQWVNEKIES